MVAVDTNVLVYAADRDSPHHTACRAWLERQRARPDAWYVTTPRHAAVAEQVVGELPHLSGNLLHDAHTAVLMREHGVRRICTRDTDFTRFPFLEVVDPLRAAR
jgi:predicted nucleic acid-binding protein